MAKYTPKYGNLNKSIKFEYLSPPVSFDYIAKDILSFPDSQWFVHSYTADITDYLPNEVNRKIEIIFDNYFNIYYFYQLPYAAKLGYLNEITYAFEKEVISYTANKTYKFYDKRENSPSMKMTDQMIDCIKFVHNRSSFDSFIPPMLLKML